MALTALHTVDHAAAWLGARLAAHDGAALRSDSRALRSGDAFIAWPGGVTDGRRYVGAALAAGACACLVDDDGVEAFGFEDARVASLPQLKANAGALAHRVLGRPSEKLQVLAVTGTNGKTSTAWWTAQALGLLGRRCGLVGTLGVGTPPLADGEAAALHGTGLTTPDPVTLHNAFSHFAGSGFEACAIEASSIGLQEHRLAGVRVAVAQFTNFTPDHLDYHGSMEAYWAAKRALFAWPGLKAAVVNTDDPQGEALATELEGTLDLWTCATLHDARLRAQNLRYEGGGLVFELHEAGRSVTVRSRLIGDYNAHNLLVVAGGLRAVGVTLDDFAAVAPRLGPVPGRMQRLGARAGAPEVVVDYAHTPDALAKALAALQPLARARGGRLWCVFGCGGDRDATKRPMMGAIAARDAGAVVLTSDNPRSEAPGLILAQILAGCSGRDDIAVIEDRREAIAHAVAQAAAADVVLVAGKGHEDYQEAQGRRIHFSDVEQAQAALQRRVGVAA